MKKSGNTEDNFIRKIGNQELKLTHQNKIYFPEDHISKGDVMDYYQSISGYILPYIINRPESMNRFPNGIHGMNFYQKDAGEHLPEWIKTEKVLAESTGEYIHYIVCNNAETLAFLNNLGCIELNVWTSRISKPQNPDYLVLDLDPSEKNTFDDVIDTALAIKEVLDVAKIEGHPKTSGKTGIHIYIPMSAEYMYEPVKEFGHLLMQCIQHKLPDLVTLERNLHKRDQDKIYLDYLQNRFAQTLASVYSLRPKTGAPVSTPLEWNELKHGIKPTDYNIFNTLQRLKEKGDLFQPVLEKRTDIPKATEILKEQLMF